MSTKRGGAGWHSHNGSSWAGCRRVFAAPAQSPAVLYISPSLPHLFSVCPELSQHPQYLLSPCHCHLFASRVQQDTYLGTQETYISSTYHHLTITILTSPPYRRNSTSPQYLLHRPLRSMCPKQSSTCAMDGSAKGYCSSFLFTSRRANFPHLISLLD